MSNRVMTWVFEQSPATGNDRLVLIAIADEADDDGTNAYPSVDRIARKARVNKRTTMRCLERLEGEGALIVHRPEKRGRGHFNTYVVVMQGERVEPDTSECKPAMRQAVIAAFDQRCAYCGEAGEENDGPDGRPWHVDRIVPASRGGAYTADNVTLSCKPCNVRKKDAILASDARPPSLAEKARNGDTDPPEKARNGDTLSALDPLTPGAKAPDPEPAPAAADARPAKGTRLPDPFLVTAEMWAWAETEGLDREWVRRETAKFCDYWRAQPGAKGRKVDWVATWRNWLRNATERLPARAATNGHARGPLDITDRLRAKRGVG